MKTSKVTFLAAAAVATMGYVGFATPAAQASSQTVVQRMNLNGTTRNDFHDLNVEYLAKGSGNTETDTIQVGDSIRGAINFESIGTGPQPTQLAGVFSLKVLALQDTGGQNADGSENYNIIFGADSASDFDTFLDSVNSAANGAGVTDGTIVRLWESPTNTVNFLGSTDKFTNMATATQGRLFQDWGYLGGNTNASQLIDNTTNDVVTSGTSADTTIKSAGGQGWVASGSINFTAAEGVSLGIPIGTSDFAMNILDNGGQIATNDVLSVTDTIRNAVIGADPGAKNQVYGSSTVQGSQGSGYDTAGFPAKSNSDAYLVAVPVPASGMLGLALFGLIGVAGAWRKFRLAA